MCITRSLKRWMQRCFLLLLTLLLFSSAPQDALKPMFTVASLPGSAGGGGGGGGAGSSSSAQPTVPTTSTTMQVTSGHSFPITNYLAPVSATSNVSANGTVLKTAGASTGVMQLPSGFTFMPGTSPPAPSLRTSAPPLLLSSSPHCLSQPRPLIPSAAFMSAVVWLIRI